MSYFNEKNDNFERRGYIGDEEEENREVLLEDDLDSMGPEYETLRSEELEEMPLHNEVEKVQLNAEEEESYYLVREEEELKLITSLYATEHDDPVDNVSVHEPELSDEQDESKNEKNLLFKKTEHFTVPMQMEVPNTVTKYNENYSEKNIINNKVEEQKLINVGGLNDENLNGLSSGHFHLGKVTDHDENQLSEVKEYNYSSIQLKSNSESLDETHLYITENRTDITNENEKTLNGVGNISNKLDAYSKCTQARTKVLRTKIEENEKPAEGKVSSLKSIFENRTPRSHDSSKHSSSKLDYEVGKVSKILNKGIFR